MNRKLHWIFNRFMAPLDAEGNETGGGGTGDGPEIDPETGAVIGVARGNDRLARMRQISLRADKLRAEELADVNDDDTMAEFVAGELDEEGNVLPPVEEPPTEEMLPEEVPPEPEVAKYKIKVNGAEKELTIDEVLALAQKADAADAKFQEAATLRKEAERTSPQTPPEQDVSANSDAELLALARALQVGSEDEAVAALKKLQGRASPPTPQLGDLYQVIDAKLAFNDANRIFKDEFADLMADERLERMVMERDAELIGAGDKRPYLERYREIGTELRAWRDTIVKSVANPQASLTEKAARKAAAPTVPTTAGGKAPQAKPDDEPEESVQQILAKMAASRGGLQRSRG